MTLVSSLSLGLDDRGRIVTDRLPPRGDLAESLSAPSPDSFTCVTTNIRDVIR
jgi:hypothetical protein